MLKLNAPIKQVGYTSKEWSEITTPLAENQIGYDKTKNRFKVGDGSKLYNELEWTSLDDDSVKNLVEESLSENDVSYVGKSHIDLELLCNADGVTDDTLTFNTLIPDNTQGYIVDGHNKHYKINKLQFINIKDVIFKNIIFSEGLSIILHSCENITFINCKFESFYDNGVTDAIVECICLNADTTIGTPCKNIYIMNCTFSDTHYSEHFSTNTYPHLTSGNCIDIRSVDNVIITDCIFTQNRGRGCIYINPSSSIPTRYTIDIRSNRFILNYFSGIYVNDTATHARMVYLSIIDNLFTGHGIGYLPEEYMVGNRNELYTQCNAIDGTIISTNSSLITSICDNKFNYNACGAIIGNYWSTIKNNHIDHMYILDGSNNDIISSVFDIDYDINTYSYLGHYIISIIGDISCLSYKHGSLSITGNDSADIIDNSIIYIYNTAITKKSSIVNNDGFGIKLLDVSIDNDLMIDTLYQFDNVTFGETGKIIPYTINTCNFPIVKSSYLSDTSLFRNDLYRIENGNPILLLNNTLTDDMNTALPSPSVDISQINDRYTDGYIDFLNNPITDDNIKPFSTNSEFSILCKFRFNESEYTSNMKRVIFSTMNYSEDVQKGIEVSVVTTTGDGAKIQISTNFAETNDTISTTTIYDIITLDEFINRDYDIIIINTNNTLSVYNNQLEKIIDTDSSYLYDGTLIIGGGNGANGFVGKMYQFVLYPSVLTNGKLGWLYPSYIDNEYIKRGAISYHISRSITNNQMIGKYLYISMDYVVSDTNVTIGIKPESCQLITYSPPVDIDNGNLNKYSVYIPLGDSVLSMMHDYDVSIINMGSSNNNELRIVNMYMILITV